MKKILGALALAALAGTTSAATVNLTENFASGATFTGVLTFSNNYDEFQAVSGTLTGGGYGTINFDWTWWIGTGQASVARDYDGIASTYEDWAMDGTPPNNFSHYLGLSWSAPGGVFQLALVPAANLYNAGINATDAVVSYSTTSAVPEADSVAMLLGGLGALAAVARRRRQA